MTNGYLIYASMNETIHSLDQRLEWLHTKFRVTNSSQFAQDFPNFSTEIFTSWDFFSLCEPGMAGYPESLVTNNGFRCDIS